MEMYVCKGETLAQRQTKQRQRNSIWLSGQFRVDIQEHLLAHSCRYNHCIWVSNVHFLRAHTIPSLYDYVTNTKAYRDLPPIAICSQMKPSKIGLVKKDPSDIKP